MFVICTVYLFLLGDDLEIYFVFCFINKIDYCLECVCQNKSKDKNGKNM